MGGPGEGAHSDLTVQVDMNQLNFRVQAGSIGEARIRGGGEQKGLWKHRETKLSVQGLGQNLLDTT